VAHRTIQTLLPRIYMIVEEINERFSRELWHLYPADWERISQMAIIGDGQVRMAHLAIVGSHSVNGVAHIHTEILKTREMKNFYNVYPHKFNNKTNGITHRRWLFKCKSKAGGPDYRSHRARLDPASRGPDGAAKIHQGSCLQEKAAAVKAQNKKALSRLYQRRSRESSWMKAPSLMSRSNACMPTSGRS
jgi:glycogen phosphorylase